MRARARTLKTYCWANAAAFAASVLAFGLVDPLPFKVALALGLPTVTLAAMVLWYRRRPSTSVGMQPLPRGGALPYSGSMTILDAIAVSVGHAANLYGELWYWIPAALVVAAALGLLAIRLPRP